MTHATYIAIRISGLALLLLACGGDVWAQERWRVLPEDMPTPRAETAVVLLDGQVYVVGGHDDEGRARDVVERFDPVFQVWEQGLPALRRARTNAAAVVLGGEIYVVGGRAQNGDVLADVEVYDPDEGRWREGAPLGVEREGHAAVVLDGRIYVIGGSDEDGGIHRTVEVYDPARGAWEESESLRLDFGRLALAAVTLTDTLYAFGGISSIGLDQRVLRYPLGGILSLLTPPQSFVARAYFGAVVRDDSASIFLIGGRGPDRPGRPNILDDVTVFVPERDLWLRAPSLEVARERFGAVSAAGRIYVFGGQDAFGDVLGSVEVFGEEVSTGAEQEPPGARFHLAQNYPNPVRAETTIAFEVDAAGTVVLEVFDLFGRRVATLVDHVLPAGRHVVRWDGTTAEGRPAASGTYVYRLSHGPRRTARVLTIIR